MAVLRYFDSSKTKKKAQLPVAVHSEFLRTGRIVRPEDTWIEEEKRYLSHEEVASITGKRLERAGETTHERLNGFHGAIHFPKLIFHRTLADAPHLGYCHVTASRTKFAEYDDVSWSFYIANFLADIGTSGSFFEHINPRQGRMYFAVAMTSDQSGEESKLVINTAVRGNGLIFLTHDPSQAMKNVLMLGARNEQLRATIRAIG